MRKHVSYIAEGISMAECFNPVAREDSRVLILGSVPGEASIAAQQYYAHPRNIFWRLVETLFGGCTSSEYSARLDVILRSHIALWDVLASARREGSLDSSIESSSEVPNDILGFLRSHPGVTHVFFNGAKAEASFKRHFASSEVPRGLELKRLPSTSPANAGMSFEAKLEAWRAIAEVVSEYLTSSLKCNGGPDPVAPVYLASA